MKSTNRVFSSFVGTYHRPDRCEHLPSRGTTIAPQLKQSSKVRQYGGKKVGVAAHLALFFFKARPTDKPAWFGHRGDGGRAGPCCSASKSVREVWLRQSDSRVAQSMTTCSRTVNPDRIATWANSALLMKLSPSGLSL